MEKLAGKPVPSPVIPIGLRISVLVIPDDGVPHGSKVRPDLVGAARHQQDLQKGAVRKHPQRPVGRLYGRRALLFLCKDPDPVCPRIFLQIPPDALLLCEPSRRQALILFVHVPVP